MDRIIIRDLTARCIIGVTPEERREKQEVVINLSIYADLRPAAVSDAFEQAIDYRGIKKNIVSLVEGSQYALVESLASAVAALCLKDARVERVKVRVEKPSALRFARSVGVELVRERGRADG